MAAELKFKKFRSPQHLCDWVNDEDIIVVDITETRLSMDVYITLYYKEKD